MPYEVYSAAVSILASTFVVEVAAIGKDEQGRVGNDDIGGEV